MFKRIVLVACVVSVMALSAPLSASAAPSALDDSPGQAASCFYDGKEYSDGAIIVGPNGNRLKCKDGTWVSTVSSKRNPYNPFKPFPVAPGPIRVDAVR